MPCVKQNNIPQVPKGREDLAERVREVLKCQAFPMGYMSQDKIDAINTLLDDCGGWQNLTLIQQSQIRVICKEAGDASKAED
ncbi:hypothetical protein ES703_09184 [subsurface metagenome]